MKVNDTIGNMKTGETLTLLISGDDNNGANCKYEIFLPAFRPSPPLHYHTDFTETFTVIKGALDFYTGREEKHTRLKPGESITAGLNELHRFANDHPYPVVFTVEAKPAGGIVKAFQLAYGVANDGGAAQDGLPESKLTRFYFIRLSGGYLATVPLFIQKTVLALAVFFLLITARKSRLDKYFN